MSALSTPDPAWPHLPAGTLRIRGTLNTRPGLAIVGARRADPYGCELAGRIANAAVQRGLSVISGGAFGIDAAAHQAALDAAGHTVAVLGSGLNHPAPRTHLPLFERILAAGGAVVSPFDDDQAATRWSFPKRNPWIAGLAGAVIVVQAGARSGTLHTARAALEHGIPVWAVPGPMDSPLHRGCHELVGQGARLLTAVDAWADATAPAPALPEGPEQGRALWDAAGVEPRPLAELAAASGLPTREALTMATHLELDGWLRAAPGGRYARAHGKRGG